MNSGVSPGCENKKNKSQRSSVMDLIRVFEDLDVRSSENTSVAKHCQSPLPKPIAIANNTVLPMGNYDDIGHQPIVTSLYKNPKLFNNNFEMLPEELILHIFKMLDKNSLTKCAYVCSQWRFISWDESLWIDFYKPDLNMRDVALDHLLRRNMKLISIQRSNIYYTTHIFETPLPKLVFLDLSAVSMNVKTLKSLLGQCSNLVYLSLEKCIVDRLCCENIGSNTKLKILNMAYTSGLDKIGLKHILSLNILEELNISWVAELEDEGLIHQLITNLMPSLKRLNVSGYIFQLGDYDLVEIRNRCPNLVKFNIGEHLTIELTTQNNRSTNIRTAFFQAVLHGLSQRHYRR